MKVSIYDLVVLQNYFASKREPSEQDNERAAKLDRHLATIADGMVALPGGEKLNIPEIFEKLTGEKLEAYR